ncbi:hypothetical protein BH09PSE4_BH09PSE4_07680 [soil metagenome]
MTLIGTEIATAHAQSEEARQRLAATLVELQARLNPRALAHEAMQELRETAEDLARSGVDAVKRNAAPLTGLAAAVGLVLARKQVGGLISLLTAHDETADAPASLKETRVKRGKDA